MSKGAGRLQREILDALQSRSPVLTSELCWNIAEAQKRIVLGRRMAGIRQGAIEKSFYSGFNRAVTVLVRKGRLRLAPRKLLSLEEVIELYPFRTTDVGVRELRERILPFISLYLAREGDGPSSEIESEESVFRLSSTSDQDRIRKDWATLEPELFDLLGALRDQSERRDLAFRVIQRGRGLFNSGYGSDPTRLGILLQKTRVGRLAIETPVYERAWSLYREAVPEDRARHANLKAQLYRIAEFYARQPVQLKWQFREALALEHPFIEQLNGNSRPRGKLPDTSELLGRLLHRNVFARFSFASLAA